jgi:hypothetical protein
MEVCARIGGYFGGIEIQFRGIDVSHQCTVQAARPKKISYKIADSGGLFLYVTVNGAKAWRYKYRVAGREKLYSLGRYPAIGSMPLADIDGTMIRRHCARSRREGQSRRQSAFAAISMPSSAPRASGWSIASS